jgi:trans-aconitate 2-methyltransferase
MALDANWDASRYHRVAQPHAGWGAAIIDRLALRGDETVLDAGCGSGRVTAQLLERLPRGRVIAADLSSSMLDQARKTLADAADRVTFVQVDLCALDTVLDAQAVDLVYSTAVFHWIADHATLFAALRRVLGDGGRMVAQFGGGDNLAGFMRAADTVVARAPFEAVLAGQHLWRFYYAPEQTEARALAAGFSSAAAWLEPSPQSFADAASLADYCRGVVLTAHVAALPDHLRETFVTQVVEEIAKREGAYRLDYVRLNLEASA